MVGKKLLVSFHIPKKESTGVESNTTSNWYRNWTQELWNLDGGGEILLGSSKNELQFVQCSRLVVSIAKLRYHPAGGMIVVNFTWKEIYLTVF